MLSEPHDYARAPKRLGDQYTRLVDSYSRQSQQTATFAHVSIEIGHFMGDSLRKSKQLGQRLRKLKPWVDAAIKSYGQRREPKFSYSTCLLLDDYSIEMPGTPETIIPKITEAYSRVDLPIDYLVRESSLSGEPAERLLNMASGLATEDLWATKSPFSGTGANTLWFKVGSDAERGDSDTGTLSQYSFPDKHPIEMLVAAATQTGKKSNWTCAALATVWQLLRLGLLSSNDNTLKPHPLDQLKKLPDEWDDVPGVLQLTHSPAPIAAFRTLSILPPMYLQVEGAVLSILERLILDNELQELAGMVAGRNGVTLPRRITDRVSYVFAR